MQTISSKLHPFLNRIQLHIQRVINHDHIRFPIILANKHPVHPVRIFFARPNTFPFQVDAHIYFLNLNTYIFSRIAVLRNSRDNHTNTFHNLSSMAYYKNRVEILWTVRSIFTNIISYSTLNRYMNKIDGIKNVFTKMHNLLRVMTQHILF